MQNCAYKVHMAHMVHVTLYCLGESSGHSGLIPPNGVSIDSVSRPLAPLCVSHRGPPHPPLAACHVLHGTVAHWDDGGRWGENWIYFNGNAQMQSTWTIMGIPLFPDFAAALHVRKDLLYSCNTMARNTTQRNNTTNALSSSGTMQRHVCPVGLGCCDKLGKSVSTASSPLPAKSQLLSARQSSSSSLLSSPTRWGAVGNDDEEGLVWVVRL